MSLKRECAIVGILLFSTFTWTNAWYATNSLASAEGSEPWRFAFTRFRDVGDLALYSHSTSIALDSNGFPHMCYVYAGYSLLKHTFYNGTSWITENIDASGSRQISTAIDSQDHARMTYVHKYAYYNGSSWVIEVFDDTAVKSTIAIDSEDTTHIAYFNGSGLQYASFDGNAWTKETVDGVCLYSQSIPVIAVGPENHPCIAYFGGLTEMDQPLKYASFNGSAWNIQTIDVMANSVSMALDPSGNAHVSYRNGTALNYAYYNGELWNVQVVTTPAGGGQLTIAIDSDVRPHIVQGSRYAYYGVNAWNITTINEEDGYDPGPWGSGGWYSGTVYSPSLSVGSDDRLHVCFIGGKYTDELRYAVGTKQHLTDLSFNNASGTTLTSLPSSVRVTCPAVPGLPVRALECTTFANQWLDSGNWTYEEVV